jgi:hypothetical protein
MSPVGLVKPLNRNMSELILELGVEKGFQLAGYFKEYPRGEMASIKFEF